MSASSVRRDYSSAGAGAHGGFRVGEAAPRSAAQAWLRAAPLMEEALLVQQASGRAG